MALFVSTLDRMKKAHKEVNIMPGEIPHYANYDSPQKFMAIQSIIAKRLIEHPKAICSYSGGSDSDIMIDVVESTRKMFDLPPVQYVFFNTGLEMKATKDHVKDVARKYNADIKEVRPKINIVLATRKYGIPFISKVASEFICRWQNHPFPLEVAKEYENADDKNAYIRELRTIYSNNKSALNYFCSCRPNGDPVVNSQLAIRTNLFLLDFLMENQPEFRISAKCCDYCKKKVAHEVQRGYDMVITGERKDEGGVRAVGRGDNINGSKCFEETSSGQYRLRPLYYVSDKDKAWYKEYYEIRYSDAYEVYGLTRTGCCGCPISYKAVDDLELIRPYEPNVVKAAWNIFGDSYRYRQQYNEYKAMRKAKEKRMAKEIEGQLSISDVMEA